MIISLCPPKNSLKNLIINLLLQSESGIDAKSIKNQVKKQYSVTATYQGINKTLRALEEEKIVIKKNSIWQLNKEWIDLVSTVLTNYSTKNMVVYNKDLKEITFDTISKALDFILINFENDSLRNGGERIYIAHAKNLGFYFLDKKQHDIMKKFGENTDIHILVENDNIVNRIAAKFFKKIGSNIYFGIPRSIPYMPVIYGNTLINVVSPYHDLTKYLIHQYQKITNITDENALNLFSDIKENPNFKIKLIFETDPVIVEQTKTLLMDMAKKGKKI